MNGRFGNVLLCAKICIIIYPLQEASWQYKRFFLHVSRTWNMTMIHKKYAEFWCLDDIHYSSSDTNFFDKFIIVYHCLSVNSAKLAHIASIFTNIPLPSLFFIWMWLCWNLPVCGSYPFSIGHPINPYMGDYTRITLPSEEIALQDFIQPRLYFLSTAIQNFFKQFNLDFSHFPPLTLWCTKIINWNL